MFQSINPVSKEVLSTYAPHSAAALGEKLDLSAAVYPLWKKVPLTSRVEMIRNIAHMLRADPSKYASVMTREMGKLKSEAEGEIIKCAWLCEYYAEYAGPFLANRSIKTDYAKSYVTYQPIGTILGIMPWNFPFWQSFRFAVPALLAGNTVLLKPAPNVPLSGLALEEIFTTVMDKKGVFQTIFAEVQDIPKIIDHPSVAGVSLTGSNRAGSAVAAQAGAAIKKCLLELGGSDPFIVLEGADLEQAIKMGFASRMVNNGQTCIAAKRFIVHEKIADAFIDGLKQKIESLVKGDPSDPATTLTVLARPDLVEQLQKQVDASVKMGATLILDGGRPDKNSNFFLPIILGNVKQGMPAYEEELFGPVFTVFIVKNDNEAVELANDSVYGLGASVWCVDVSRAETVALQLNVGAVAINDMVKSDPRLPFGGVNQSGFGRELAMEGLLEFVNIKSVVVNV